MANLITIANLDSDKVYQGTLEIDEADLTAEQVIVPADCDLPIGKYYWKTSEKSFFPTQEFLKSLGAN